MSRDVAKFARLFGLPAPVLTTDGMGEGMECLVDLMKKKISFESYDMLQSSIGQDFKDDMAKAGGDEGKKKKQARGITLGDFRALLDECDPKGGSAR